MISPMVVAATIQATLARIERKGADRVGRGEVEFAAELSATLVALFKEIGMRYNAHYNLPLD
jgi:hypothetical protein